jgi:hypothetical protein
VIGVEPIGALAPEIGAASKMPGITAQMILMMTKKSELRCMKNPCLIILESARLI